MTDFLPERSLAWLRSLMDEIDYGLVLWADGRAVHVNRPAQQRLREAGCPLRIVDGRIRTDDADEELALTAALEDAASRRRRRMLTLRGRNAGDAVLPVAVVPFGPDAQADRTSMVVLGKRELCPELSAHWFCTMHQLTPMESSVLADLLAGHDPREIARRNGVALTTVRTQIARISDKTSLRGIRELIRAAASLPPVMTVDPTPTVPYPSLVRAMRAEGAALQPVA